MCTHIHQWGKHDTSKSRSKSGAGVAYVCVFNTALYQLVASGSAQTWLSILHLKAEFSGFVPLSVSAVLPLTRRNPCRPGDRE